jgi:addiction module HigA family antidote
MSASGLALAQRVPSGRITSILNTKRVISADTALWFARHLGTRAQFWLNLQTGDRLRFRHHRARLRCRVAAEVERRA